LEEKWEEIAESGWGGNSSGQRDGLQAQPAAGRLLLLEVGRKREKDR
jgi:hypothetical protein